MDPPARCARPGRFSILEHANLDDPSANHLIVEIWPDL
jgi:hypothetical protein